MSGRVARTEIGFYLYDAANEQLAAFSTDKNFAQKITRYQSRIAIIEADR
jgi:hypothetical protein